MSGLFVALEGGDGAGKSTQARLLAERLRAAGHDVVLTHEPGDSSIGRALRAILLGPSSAVLDPRTEALLYAADRAQHVLEVVRPALDRGAIVVTDRYADSSVAYQGAGRRLGTEAVETLSRFATGGLQPQLTLLLDLAPRAALARHDPADHDRIEGEPVEFHERVRAAFTELAAREPARYAVIDAARPPEQVAAAIAEQVEVALAPRSASVHPERAAR